MCCGYTWYSSCASPRYIQQTRQGYYCGTRPFQGEVRRRCGRGLRCTACGWLAVHARTLSFYESDFFWCRYLRTYEYYYYYYAYRRFFPRGCFFTSPFLQRQYDAADTGIEGGMPQCYVYVVVRACVLVVQWPHPFQGKTPVDLLVVVLLFVLFTMRSNCTAFLLPLYTQYVRIRTTLYIRVSFYVHAAQVHTSTACCCCTPASACAGGAGVLSYEHAGDGSDRMHAYRGLRVRAAFNAHSIRPRLLAGSVLCVC